MIHAAYLINLAAPDPSVLSKSTEAMVDELQRAEQLKIPYLVLHPGSPRGQDEAKGIHQIARQLDQAFTESHTQNVTALLEITAGQGHTLGYCLEHLRDIMAHSKHEERLGICLDTCHMFAAGYDFRTPEAWEQTFQTMKEIVGLQKIKALHLNDSLYPLGSRRDRHARIGEGMIGLDGFRTLLQDRRLWHCPMILEIPGGLPAYAEDLKKLRRLLKTLSPQETK